MSICKGIAGARGKNPKGIYIHNIVPSDNTIMLHQEVYATACPHRSVEIHGGREGCKRYFIQRIKELMGSVSPSNSESETNNESIKEKERTMQCFYTVDGKGPIMYFDGMNFHPLSHPDEMSVLNSIYKANNGKDMPSFSWESGAPWHARLENAIKRIAK